MDFSKDNKFNSSLFARKTNWKNADYQYLKNVTITEWDIASAGLSVIKFKKLLPEIEIQKLEGMTKKMRTIREGLFQKENPELASQIVKTLEDVRQAYVLINGITENDVLSIKKDAIFILNKVPTKNTVKEYFTFRQKNTYTTFVNLNKVEFYFDTFSGRLDTKGISDDSLKLQENFLISDIKRILSSAEKLNRDKVFSILQNYRKKYLERKLPIETYRELDSGLFRCGDYFFEGSRSINVK